jgi:hypothetical protein
VLGHELAEHVRAALARRSADERRIGLNDVEPGDRGDGTGDVTTLPCRLDHGVEHFGDPHEPFAALVGRCGDRLLEALLRPQAGSPYERAEHRERSVGERRFKFAQRCDHDGVAPGEPHLLKGLRRATNALARHLHEPRAIGIRDGQVRHAGRAQEAELVEQLEEGADADP